MFPLQLHTGREVRFALEICIGEHGNRQSRPNADTRDTVRK
jgi:hypothetical protein